MYTQKFRSKTLFIDRANPASAKTWGVAVDIGYSGTKVFSPNRIACFPSFAVPVTGSIIASTVAEDDAILYRDGIMGETWKVGRIAQNTISPQDPDTSTMTIYGRQRYTNPMFLVLARVAMALGATPNEYGDPTGKKLYVQTGLPNTYLKHDYPIMAEVLCTTHVFDVKVGNEDWRHYELKLGKENLLLMPQPLGTLLSISSDDSGNVVADAGEFYNQTVLIVDPGFGTLDTFSFKGGEMNGVETSDSLGMKEVLLLTSNRLHDEFQVEMPVPAMQKALEDGYVTRFDRAKRRAENKNFDKILQECNEAVANKAIDKLFEMYNNLLDYKYLVLTGGTGEAWYKIFEEQLSGMPNLTLVPGNKNTEGLGPDGEALPFIFSNVRGYYIFLQRKLTA